MRGGRFDIGDSAEPSTANPASCAGEKCGDTGTIFHTEMISFGILLLANTTPLSKVHMYLLWYDRKQICRYTKDILTKLTLLK